MKNLGTLIMSLGGGIVIIVAVLRRISLENLESLGVGRSAILPAMLVGAAIFAIGFFISRKATPGKD